MNSTRWKDGRFRDEDHRQAVLASNRESYARHADKYRIRAAKRNAELKMAALEACGGGRCHQCGFNHPGALEFHHSDPTTKRFNLAHALPRTEQYPWGEILNELAKCIVLCANCHKIEHCKRTYDFSEVLDVSAT